MAFPTPAPRQGPRSRARRLALAAAIALTAGLTGCGGGLYLTVPVGGYDDSPPSVALSALPGFVQPGGLLTLGAAAASGYGIEQVAFYRIDGRSATFVGADSSPPYQATTSIPFDGRPEVAYFARATDGVGRVAESAVVVAPVAY